MKNPYAPLVLLLALTAPAARAQQAWQPFRPGLSYHYSEAGTPGDTTHVLQLGAGASVPGTTDTLYRFTGRAVRLRATAASCYGFGQLRADNLFGATLRSRAGKVFVLAAANGLSLTLRLGAAVGQSWATGLPGLTAQVTGRGIGAVSNTLNDSVATIGFSDGQALRLSKNYGLLNGPSLDSYLNGRNRRRALLLTALPERGIGRFVTGPRAVYDFQAGDVFQYTSRFLTTGPMLCQEGWRQDSVVSRRLSASGDTLIYSIYSRYRQQGHGVAGAPSPFCSVPNTATFGTYTNVVRVAAGSPYLNANPLPDYYYPNQALTGPIVHNSARYNGRPEVEQITTVSSCQPTADSVYIGGVIDQAGLARTAAGLGRTYTYSSSMGTDDRTEELTAYRKGTEAWGVFFPRGFLLAARPQRPASTTAAFPNPFGTSLTARFELAHPQAVTAELRDALGRTVQTKLATALGTGPQQLTLPTTGLPPGVYILHLRFAADGHSEVLRVVRE